MKNLEVNLKYSKWLLDSNNLTLKNQQEDALIENRNIIHNNIKNEILKPYNISNNQVHQSYNEILENLNILKENKKISNKKLENLPINIIKKLKKKEKNLINRPVKFNHNLVDNFLKNKDFYLNPNNNNYGKLNNQMIKINKEPIKLEIKKLILRTIKLNNKNVSFSNSFRNDSLLANFSTIQLDEDHIFQQLISNLKNKIDTFIYDIINIIYNQSKNIYNKVEINLNLNQTISNDEIKRDGNLAISLNYIINNTCKILENNFNEYEINVIQNEDFECNIPLNYNNKNYLDKIIKLLNDKYFINDFCIHNKIIKDEENIPVFGVILIAMRGGNLKFLEEFWEEYNGSEYERIKQFNEIFRNFLFEKDTYFEIIYDDETLNYKDDIFLETIFNIVFNLDLYEICETFEDSFINNIWLNLKKSLNFFRGTKNSEQVNLVNKHLFDFNKNKIEDESFLDYNSIKKERFESFQRILLYCQSYDVFLKKLQNKYDNFEVSLIFIILNELGLLNVKINYHRIFDEKISKFLNENYELVFYNFIKVNDDLIDAFTFLNLIRDKMLYVKYGTIIMNNDTYIKKLFDGNLYSKNKLNQLFKYVNISLFKEIMLNVIDNNKNIDDEMKLKIFMELKLSNEFLNNLCFYLTKNIIEENKNFEKNYILKNYEILKNEKSFNDEYFNNCSSPDFLIKLFEYSSNMVNHLKKTKNFVHLMDDNLNVLESSKKEMILISYIKYLLLFKKELKMNKNQNLSNMAIMSINNEMLKIQICINQCFSKLKVKNNKLKEFYDKIWDENKNQKNY